MLAWPEMTTGSDDSSTVAIVVAHPDDETLWAGGALLMHPQWRCKVFTLCRAGDPDRSPKFHRALARLGASGAMADLDDRPEQTPLADALVRQTVSTLIAGSGFDLLLTHSPHGEYTRHRRHGEVFAAVRELWEAGAIDAGELWLFAYEDGDGAYFPRARTDAGITLALPQSVWDEKYRIIHEVYGYAPDSWEAQTTPKVEAFRRFSSPAELNMWLRDNEVQR